MVQKSVIEQILKAVNDAVDCGTFGEDVAAILVKNGLMTEEKFQEIVGGSL